MEIRLLGVTEASADGRPVALGAAQQRAVLAMLALQAGAPVALDRLIEGLWGEQAPASAHKMVQLYVSQLRRLPGGAEIATRGRGYELRLPADAVDALRFEQLVEAAERGEPGAAAAALGLWRGTPLADLLDVPFAAAEARRLEELWLRARELDVDEALAAGRSREVAAELETLVAAHPLRERLHAQRMLALYRSGRQADALAAYQSAHRVLGEEAGVEPGPELRRLHEAMLHQDPSLDGPRPHGVRVGRPRSRRAVWAVAAAGLATVAAIAAVVAFAGGADAIVVAPDSAAAIDARTGEVVAAVRVGEGPGPVAAGTDAVWVLNLTSETMSRIDLAGRRLLGTRGLGGVPGNIAASPDEVWVSSQCGVGGDPGALVHVHSDGVDNVLGGDEIALDGVLPVDGAMPQQPTSGCGLVASGPSVWIASNVPPGLVRADFDVGTARSQVVWARALANVVTAVAVGADAVWALDADDTVLRIDPESGRVDRELRAGTNPVAIAASEDAVWVANEGDDSVSRIDPRTNAVSKAISVGDGPAAIATGGGAVWVALGGDRALARIDPDTGEVADTIELGRPPQGVAVAGGTVWVTVR